jgi:cbb3-type cytochrome oxidase maturation protein
MMDEATIAQLVFSAIILVIFLGFLIWGIRSGQFKNIEEAKYKILEDETEDEDEKEEVNEQ